MVPNYVVFRVNLRLQQENQCKLAPSRFGRSLYITDVCRVSIQNRRIEVYEVLLTIPPMIPRTSQDRGENLLQEYYFSVLVCSWPNTNTVLNIRTLHIKKVILLSIGMSMECGVNSSMCVALDGTRNSSGPSID